MHCTHFIDCWDRSVYLASHSHVKSNNCNQGNYASTRGNIWRVKPQKLGSFEGPGIGHMMHTVHHVSYSQPPIAQAVGFIIIIRSLIAQTGFSKLRSWVSSYHQITDILSFHLKYCKNSFSWIEITCVLGPVQCCKIATEGCWDVVTICINIWSLFCSVFPQLWIGEPQLWIWRAHTFISVL